MKIFSRRSVQILLAVLFLGIVVGWMNRFSLVKFSNMKAFFKASPSQTIKLYESEIIEDREILAQYELFQVSRGEKDAGPYLNPMVHWQLGDIPHRGSLTLPEFVHKEMSQDWVTKKPLFKKMGLNFGWMKKLLEYDVWSPEVGSPAYPEGKNYDPFSAPVLNYKDLMTWAKLRYLYGKEIGDVPSALKEVRHLTRLIWTNDLLVSSMVVISLLKIENQFEEIIIPKEMGQWAFIPTDHLMRAKRYFYSSPSFVDVRLSDDLFDKLTKTNVGLCAMLNEGLAYYLANRVFLAKELSYGFKRMDEKVQTSSCRKSYVRKLWDNPDWIYEGDISGFTIAGKNVTWDDVKANDDIRATVGYLLKSVSTPNYIQYGK